MYQRVVLKVMMNMIKVVYGKELVKNLIELIKILKRETQHENVDLRQIKVALSCVKGVNKLYNNFTLVVKVCKGRFSQPVVKLA